MGAYSKSQFAESFKQRTKKFTIESVRFFQALPKTSEASILGKQLLRCATSVGANYRTACRARSEAEFYAKISIVVEEADESIFWMEVLVETGIIPESRVTSLLKEATEILKVVSSARKTISSKRATNI